MDLYLRNSDDPEYLGEKSESDKHCFSHCLGFTQGILKKCIMYLPNKVMPSQCDSTNRRRLCSNLCPSWLGSSLSHKLVRPVAPSTSKTTLCNFGNTILCAKVSPGEPVNLAALHCCTSTMLGWWRTWWSKPMAMPLSLLLMQLPEQRACKAQF